jgi:Spy/CpxP family protein refolding chaperone
MKKILVLCSMMFVLFASATAQEAPAKFRKDGERSKEMKANVEKVKSELNLDEKQVAAVKELRQWHKGTIKSIKSNGALSKEQKKQQVQEANAKRDEKIKTILSPEQLTKWEALKAKGKKGKGHGKHHRGGEQDDDGLNK